LALSSLARWLVGSQLVGQLGGIYGASQNRWGPYVSGHFAHFPRFVLHCTKSTGTRAGDGSKDHVSDKYLYKN
jgi:hypothetical protein